MTKVQKVKIIDTEQEKYEVLRIDKDRLVKVSGAIKLPDGCIIKNRIRGEFADHAIYLPGQYNYVITRDDFGILCLLPYKREG